MGKYLRSTSVAEMDDVLRRYAQAPHHIYPEFAVRRRWAEANDLYFGTPVDRARLDAAFDVAYRRIRTAQSRAFNDRTAADWARSAGRSDVLSRARSISRHLSQTNPAQTNPAQTTPALGRGRLRLVTA